MSEWSEGTSPELPLELLRICWPGDGLRQENDVTVPIVGCEPRADVADGPIGASGARGRRPNCPSSYFEYAGPGMGCGKRMTSPYQSWAASHEPTLRMA